MIVIFFLFFLSVSFSGFYIDRTDKITLIVSPDYHEINRTKEKYRTIDEVHAHRKSKNRSATVVFNGSGEEYRRKKEERDIYYCNVYDVF
jgi:endo-alpha-1,4-polygalactosaminidase (GH114 family)